MTTTQKLFLENDQIILRNENGKLSAIIHEFDSAILKGTELKVTIGKFGYIYKDVFPSGEVSVNCKKIAGLMVRDAISLVRTDNIVWMKFYQTSVGDEKPSCMEDITKFTGFAPIIEDNADSLLIALKPIGGYFVFCSSPFNVDSLLCSIYTTLKNQSENNEFAEFAKRVEFADS